MSFKVRVSTVCLPVLFFLCGCGGGTTVTNQTTPEPEAGVSTPSLAFGNQPVGQASAAQTVTLTNSGNATLAIAGVALSDTTNYILASACGASLAAQASCSVTVTFKPQSAASLPATLTFTDNSSGLAGTEQTVSITGTGTAAQAVLSTNTLSFAATAVGSTAAAQTVTLSNPGNATLTGISASVTGSAPAGTFPLTTTCGTTLNAQASCTFSVAFTPAAGAAYTDALAIADSAANSPQSVTLSGTGTAPQLSLSATSIAFPTTSAGSTSAAQTVTLTNSGNATLNLSSITLGGANASAFPETTTCGSTLAAQASCAITVRFAPAAATAYAASITITDNAAGSPQTISLSGTGSSSTVTYTLYTFPETDNSVTPLYALVNNAQKTIDMTMYALEDTTFSADLVAACKRGVTVRVVLDQNDEKSGNTAAYNQLNAQSGCSAVWANKAFEATHEKAIVFDNSLVAIMSLNLQSQYYSTTRDFAMVENDANDVAAVEATFSADYAAGTPSSGVAGPSDFSYVPGLGDDLIWSPTTAQAAMLSIINNATTTLVVENEEMGASNIVSALEAACQRGVTVEIAMVSQSSYGTNFKALENAGCGVHVYPDTTTGFYIHAKAVVADYGLATQNVYMGSINYSTASMNNNRELGMYITDAASVQALYTTMTADYAGGSPY